MAEGVEWLSAEETARFLKVHANTVYRMIRDGKLLARRFPVRIRREDLDGVIERCRIKPGELAHLNAYASGCSPSLGYQDRAPRSAVRLTHQELSALGASSMG